MRISLIPKIALASAWTASLASVATASVSLGIWAGDHVMPRVWIRGVFGIFGIRVETTGQDRLGRDKRYVIVANHDSILDGMAVILCLDNMPRFVGKAEVGKLPILGRTWKKLGHILIDRDDPEGAYGTLEAAAKDLGQSYSVYFAPEGTRSHDGKLGRFKKGAFAYAQHAGLPVVPVAVEGAGALMPKGSLNIHPGTIRVDFGDPFHVNDVAHARNRAHSWIAAQLARRRDVSAS